MLSIHHVNQQFTSNAYIQNNENTDQSNQMDQPSLVSYDDRSLDVMHDNNIDVTCNSLSLSSPYPLSVAMRQNVAITHNVEQTQPLRARPPSSNKPSLTSKPPRHRTVHSNGMTSDHSTSSSTTLSPATIHNTINVTVPVLQLDSSLSQPFDESITSPSNTHSTTRSLNSIKSRARQLSMSVKQVKVKSRLHRTLSSAPEEDDDIVSVDNTYDNQQTSNMLLADDRSHLSSHHPIAPTTRPPPHKIQARHHKSNTTINHNNSHSFSVISPSSIVRSTTTYTGNSISSTPAAQSFEQSTEICTPSNATSTASRSTTSSLRSRKFSLSVQTNNKLIVTDSRAAGDLLIPSVVDSEYISTKQLTPVNNVADAIRTCIKDIKSSEWDIRFDAITLLRRLAVCHGATTISSHMKQLCADIRGEIDSLRSSLSKNALLCVCDLFEYCGRSASDELDILLPSLIKRASESSFLADQAHLALAFMIQYCHESKVLYLLLNMISSGKAMTRNVCAIYLDKYVELYDIKIMKCKEFDRFIKSIGTLINEASTVARSNARNVLLRLQVFTSTAQLCDICQRSLPANQFASIKKTLDKSSSQLPDHSYIHQPFIPPTQPSQRTARLSEPQSARTNHTAAANRSRRAHSAFYADDIDQYSTSASVDCITDTTVNNYNVQTYNIASPKSAPIKPNRRIINTQPNIARPRVPAKTTPQRYRSESVSAGVYYDENDDNLTMSTRSAALNFDQSYDDTRSLMSPVDDLLSSQSECNDTIHINQRNRVQSASRDRPITNAIDQTRVSQRRVDSAVSYSTGMNDQSTEWQLINNLLINLRHNDYNIRLTSVCALADYVSIHPSSCHQYCTQIMDACITLLHDRVQAVQIESLQQLVSIVSILRESITPSLNSILTVIADNITCTTQSLSMNPLILPSQDLYSAIKHSLELPHLLQPLSYVSLNCSIASRQWSIEQLHSIVALCYEQGNIAQQLVIQHVLPVAYQVVDDQLMRLFGEIRPILNRLLGLLYWLCGNSMLDQHLLNHHKLSAVQSNKLRAILMP